MITSKAPLPTGCACKSDASNARVTCTKTIGGQSVTAEVEILPCATPSPQVDVLVTQPVSYECGKVSSPAETSVPIPGLSFEIGPASLQGRADIMVSGGSSDLSVQVGIDGCANVLGVKKCGKDITDELPAWLVNGGPWSFPCSTAGTPLLRRSD